MFSISIGNSFTKVAGYFPNNFKTKVEATMSYMVEGYQFMAAYKRGVFDGRVRLFKSVSPELHVFPAGLTGMFVDLARANNYEYVIEDARVYPSNSIDPEWVLPFDRRYYQTEAAEAAIKATKGVLEIATAGGKTITAAYIFYLAKVKGLVVVVSNMAAQDTVDDFKKALSGISVGMWSGDSKEIGDVTVCTIQALLKADDSSPLKLAYNSADITIWDEVHSYGGGEFYKFAVNCNSYYKIGMSGTAYRKDAKEVMLFACTGRVIYRKKASELQKEGYLAKSKIRFVKSPPPNHVTAKELVKMEKNDLYREAIVNNEPRNRLILKFIEEYKDKSIAIGIRLKEHGDILSKLTGIPFLNGDANAKQRKIIRDGLKSGELNRIIGTSIIDQSVDFPKLKVFLNWGGYSPRVAQIQRLGRILRVGDGSEAIFIDLIDDWNTVMKKHSLQRVTYMKKENLEVEIDNELEIYTGINLNVEE